MSGEDSKRKEGETKGEKEREPLVQEEVEAVLLAPVKRILEVADDACFESDFDFFRHCEAVFVVRSLRRRLEVALEHRVTGQLQQPGEDEVRNGAELQRFSEQWHDVVLGKLASRLAAHEAAVADENNTEIIALPRMERLVRAFELSAAEREIFFTIAVQHISESTQRNVYLPGGMPWGGHQGMTGLALAAMLGISLDETRNFFDSGRKHVKEGLVPTLEHIHYPVGRFSEVTLTTLLGMPLSTSQFLSLESQTLTTIVEEEPGFKDTPAGKSALGKLDDDDMPPPPDLQAQGSFLDQLRTGGDQEETLYALLKKEEDREREAAEAMGMAVGMVGVGEAKQAEAGADGSGKPGEDADGADARPGTADPAAATAEEDKEDAGGDEEEMKEYENDLQYLQDQFHLVVQTMKVARLRRQIEDSLDIDEDEHKQMQQFGYSNDMYDPSTGQMYQKEQLKQKRESNLRKLKNKERLQKRKIERRMQLTRQKGVWVPRMERLAGALDLDPFEKNMLVGMVGAAIAPSTVNFNLMRADPAQAQGTSRASVNDLLNCFCASLEEQINCRKFFYKSATLVKEGILTLQGTDFAGDLTQCVVEIDRRMLDFVVGLDTEFSEIVDGSHLYMPEVNMEDVILPDDMKELMMNTVRNFDTYKLVQKNLELDKKLSYGRGMALLFYGQSGTGKTMMANALASMLGKKMLLINFPSFGTNSAGAIIKLIFREAVIHDAIVFFDECESLFRTREHGTSQVNMLLTELERHAGLSILATNRPYDLDEAMHRRITLALEFRKPDHLMRERIWQSLCPPKLQLADDVALGDLALKYELTGGFIKNSWLSALSIAVSRDGTRPVVTHEDLRQGAAHQLRGRLSMVDFDRRIVPTRGLEDVVLPESLKESLNTIVNFGKAQTILFGQWGFQKQHGSSKGIAALFYGPPGTGKTMAAEAIGYDLGKPLKVVNCAQLLSKWVGESQKNIDQIFEEAKAVDAVLVFDEAEGLFGSRGGGGGGGGSEASRHDTMNVGVLLHHIETFPGVVVIITNLREQLDAAFSRRFKFMLEFSMPDVDLRTRLWRLLVPEEAPLTDDVDLRVLAERHEMTGGAIKSAVFRAASRAALRPDVEQRRITQEDLIQACDEEFEKSGESQPSMSMYT